MALLDELDILNVSSSVYSELADPVESFKNSTVIDEYSLEDITIVTPVQNVSLKAMMIEISYYEDIFNCSTSGHVLVKDSISLIESLGLCGNEFIKLVFRKSNKSNVQFFRYFRVYRVSERTLDNLGTETYTIHFCSEELFLSEQIKVSKSYKNKQISSIINDVLKNYLKIPNNRINVDASDGLYDIIIPFKKPFEAINWLINLAQPLGKEGADYLFFENQDGFNFVSLQKLFEKKIYSEYVFNPNNAGRLNDTTELNRSFYTIKSYKFLDTFDSLYGVVTGAFANRVLVVDSLTREFRDVKFDYSKYFNSTNKLNKAPVIGQIKNRLGKTPNENFDSVFKVVNSNYRQKFATYLKDKPSEVTNDIMAEIFVPFRTAQIALSTYSRIRLSLTGDPQLSVGQIIKVNLPSNVSDSGDYRENKEFINPYSSGKYLITSVRHIIDTKFRYETVIEIAKESFSKEFPSSENNEEFATAKKGNK